MGHDEHGGFERVVTAPASCYVEGPAPTDDGVGTFAGIGRAGEVGTQHPVVGVGDEAVERHRHISSDRWHGLASGVEP